MLACCQLHTLQSMKFRSKHNNVYSQKYFLRICLQNMNHFGQTSMCYDREPLAWYSCFTNKYAR